MELYKCCQLLASSIQPAVDQIVCHSALNSSLRIKVSDLTLIVGQLMVVCQRQKFVNSLLSDLYNFEAIFALLCHSPGFCVIPVSCSEHYRTAHGNP